jgi:hypothetical protein
MKRFSLLRMAALTSVLVALVPPATVADENDKKTVVSFTQPTEVPGIVLQPGTYVIKLVNSQSNRHIAEIMNEKMDHLYALTFTAAAARVQRTGKPVLTFYEGSNGRPPALRMWFWPGEVDGQEFLYPKDQAAKIAAATGQKVAEGGLPTVAESRQSLIPDNQSTSVSQSREEAKPVAAPLTANAAEPEAAPPPVVIAQNTPPAQAQTSPEPAPRVEIAQSNSAASPVEVNSPNSSDKTLPQTASYLPLAGVLGLISLGLAIVVSSIRRSHSL